MPSTTAADLGGPLSIGPNAEDWTAAEKTFEQVVDKGSRVTQDTSVVDGRSFKIVTTDGGGSVEQKGLSLSSNDTFGKTVTIRPENGPDIILTKGADPTVGLKQDFGDIVLGGSLSQSRTASVSAKLGNDSANVEGVVTNDGPQSVKGTLSEGPLKLTGTYDPNSDVVTGTVSLNPKIQIDDEITLGISGKTTFSSDSMVETDHELMLTVDAKF